MTKNAEQQALETLQKVTREQTKKCSEIIHQALVEYNCKMVPRFTLTGTYPEHVVFIVPRKPGEPLPTMKLPESL